MDHWHAFAYTGHERPRDSEARNPQSPTPPNEVSMWFRKPASMQGPTFTEADPAHAWLAKELQASPPPPSAVSADLHLTTSRTALEAKCDAYVGYYTAKGRFLVRALLTCPRAGERCPAPHHGE